MLTEVFVLSAELAAFQFSSAPEKAGDNLCHKRLPVATAKNACLWLVACCDKIIMQGLIVEARGIPRKQKSERRGHGS